MMPAELPPAGAFCEVYRAWCNYYLVKPSEELIHFVLDSVVETPRYLDLAECPGVEPGTSISFDLAPVFSSLRFNQYFQTVCLSDIPAPNAMQLLAGCMKTNCTITRLVLTNLQSTYASYHATP